MTVDIRPNVAELRAAIWNKKVVLIRKLLSDDKSLANCVFLHGGMVSTPLLEAIDKRHAQMVGLLLDAGADPNMAAPDPGGPTRFPLTEAAGKGDVEVVGLLLKAGGNPSGYFDTRPWITPLNSTFTTYGKPAAMLEVAKALIEAGANLNGHPPYTPLRSAAGCGFTAGLELLAEAGADLSPVSLLGALLSAIQAGWAKADCLEWFVARGVDPAGAFPNENDFAEAAGLTFAEFAHRSGNTKAATFFEKSTTKSAKASGGKRAAPRKAKLPKDWPGIKAALAEVAPKIHQSLRPPATDAALATLEKKIGRSLPTQFQEAYLASDGQVDRAESFIRGPDETSCHYVLLPLSEVRLLAATFSRDELAQYSSDDVHADRGVAKEWCAAGWLAFAENGGGDFYCVDLEPPKGGVAGQVIHFSHETGDRPRVAKSLDEFLRAQVVASVESTGGVE